MTCFKVSVVTYSVSVRRFHVLCLVLYFAVMGVKFSMEIVFGRRFLPGFENSRLRV